MTSSIAAAGSEDAPRTSPSSAITHLPGARQDWKDLLTEEEREKLTQAKRESEFHSARYRQVYTALFTSAFKRYEAKHVATTV